VKRTADLTLEEDGTLDGKVKLEYFGQQAITRRRDNFRASEAKRKENAEDEIKVRMSTAEISDLLIENFDDTSKPLTYSYKIRIPNYATRTGQRLFLQPSFFEYGRKPAFSAAARLHSIHFAYPWSEQDSVEIRLPASFDMDSPTQQGPIEDPKKIASHRVEMNLDKAKHTLRYTRNFHFGGGANVLFPKEAYPTLKRMFDAFHKADSHLLALKRGT
jgi:hypothetical protein